MVKRCNLKFDETLMWKCCWRPMNGQWRWWELGYSDIHNNKPALSTLLSYIFLHFFNHVVISTTIFVLAERERAIKTLSNKLWDSIILHALGAFVPYVPRALRVSCLTCSRASRVLYLTCYGVSSVSCRTCSHASLTSCSMTSRASHASCSTCPRASRAWCLTCLVPYVLSCLTWLVPHVSCAVRALVPQVPQLILKSDLCINYYQKEWKTSL